MTCEVTLRLDDMPLALIADKCFSAAPFVHQDRVLEHHVLLYVLEGGIEVVEEGMRHKVGPGDVLLLRAGCHHWGEHTCTPGMSWVYVHFMLPCADKPAEHAPVPVRSQEFVPDDYARAITLPKLSRIEPDGAVAQRLLRMARLFASDHPLRAAYISTMLMETLLDLHALGSPAPMDMSDPVATAIALLERGVERPFSAGLLARGCGLSYKYLAAQFKAQTGMSPQTYHTRLRMSEAARMLRESAMSVSEISDRLGFCNPQYFSRVFASVYAIAPREYRRRGMRG